MEKIDFELLRTEFPDLAQTFDKIKEYVDSSDDNVINPKKFIEKFNDAFAGNLAGMIKVVVALQHMSRKKYLTPKYLSLEDGSETDDYPPNATPETVIPIYRYMAR